MSGIINDHETDSMCMSAVRQQALSLDRKDLSHQSRPDCVINLAMFNSNRGVISSNHKYIPVAKF